MEPGKSTELSSIAERMNRLRTRMYLEKVSGIAVSEKGAFLAYCQKHELAEETQQQLIHNLEEQKGNHKRFDDFKNTCYIK